VLLVSASIGGPGVVFPEEVSAAVPFAFPRAVRRVHCLLSGFECSFPDGDHHLTEVSIRPVVEFDDQVSPTTGLVRVDLTWRDRGAGVHAAHAAGFFVRLLVIGTE
jgi:hypothetical protein